MAGKERGWTGLGRGAGGHDRAGESMSPTIRRLAIEWGGAHDYAPRGAERTPKPDGQDPARHAALTER
jgi:hypothetical protein